MSDAEGGYSSDYATEQAPAEQLPKHKSPDNPPLLEARVPHRAPRIESEHSDCHVEEMAWWSDHILNALQSIRSKRGEARPLRIFSACAGLGTESMACKVEQQCQPSQPTVLIASALCEAVLEHSTMMTYISRKPSPKITRHSVLWRCAVIRFSNLIRLT
jgi:hypothetical protein